MLVAAWEREHATTMKVLKSLPAGYDHFKPTAEKTKAANELAGVFIAELNVAEGVVKGEIDLSRTRDFKAPPNFPDVLWALEKTYQYVLPMVKDMPESDWNSTMAFATGPKQMGQVRRGDVLWLMLMDMVHHRGQFSLYLRLIGAKVPSIYGPSADEPWT